MRRLAVLVGIAVLVGCGEDDPAGAPSFEDVPWTQASGAGATFTDGKVAGSTGCNRFTGSYTQDGSSLEIDTPAVTRKACPPPADAVEREFLAALARVDGWRIDDGDLALVDGDDKELLRFSEASPVGAWKATMFRQRDAVASLEPGTEISAVFDEKGTLAGTAGCNTYRATFTTDGDAITIDKPAATEKACTTPPGVMEQEQAYLSALPLAASYRVEGSILSLLTAEGTFVATYERAP